MNSSKNCLSYWFPKLKASGVPVPRTEIIKTRVPLVSLLDGTLPRGYRAFMARLRQAADAIGYPCFLRTGQTSGKHQWRHTCFVESSAVIPAHVAALVEFSELAGFPIGLPYDVWAVRKLLRTRPVCVLPRYDNFPLVPEIRCFIDGGEIVCWHHYWPHQAIEEGFPYRMDDSTDSPSRDLPNDFEEIVSEAQIFVKGWRKVVCKVAQAFAGDGAWSVDLIPVLWPKTGRRHYVTDMAVAEDSFHWHSCPANRWNAPEMDRQDLEQEST